MTKEEIDAKVNSIKKIWVGKHVKVKGEHPHSGEIGEVIDFQKAGITGQWGLIVKTEWESFFVFDIGQLFVIP